MVEKVLILALSLAAVLSVVSFFSERLLKHTARYHDQMISASAGSFIALIFAEFFPRIFSGAALIGAPSIDKVLFAIVIFGFLGFHLAEKYVYQHVRERAEMMRELAELHVLGFFVDHFMVGFVLALLSLISAVDAALIIFVPFVAHVVVSAFSLRDIRTRAGLGTPFDVFLSSAPLIGAAAIAFLPLSLTATYAIFAYVTGALLYLTVRDVLPTGRKGRPFWTAAVAVATLVVIAIA